MELDELKYMHLVGIKGVAMTALAVYAKERGIAVTGSDTADVFPTDGILKKAGIAVSEGFSPGHIPPVVQMVVYTGAHGGRDNPEVVEARRRGIPTFAHGPALGWFMAPHTQVSVAGSHGKTTTTAMVATVLTAAGMDPSYADGCGEIFGLGLPGHYGLGDIFVAEADEYVTDPKHDRTPRFLWQKPDVLIVTNIDYDHPDAYESLSAVQDAFTSLQKAQKGMKLTVVNADDPSSAVLRKTGNPVVTYGMAKDADVSVTGVRFGTGVTAVDLAASDGMHTLKLRVPGRHNALNAAAAAAAARALGVSWEAIAKGLWKFRGTKRRFELIGKVSGITVYDDYAHHPHEIAATLSAARAWFPERRIIAVFQPHTYSRTKALMSGFATAFGSADTVILTDIYASARESDTLGLSGTMLTEETGRHHKHVRFAPGYPDVADVLESQMKRGDVVIFMGAGSIFTWGHEFVAAIRGKGKI